MYVLPRGSGSRALVLVLSRTRTAGILLANEDRQARVSLGRYDELGILETVSVSSSRVESELTGLSDNAEFSDRRGSTY